MTLAASFRISGSKIFYKGKPENQDSWIMARFPKLQVPTRLATGLAIETTSVSAMKLVLGLVHFGLRDVGESAIPMSDLSDLTGMKADTVRKAVDIARVTRTRFHDVDGEPLEYDLVSDFRNTDLKVVGAFGTCMLILKSTSDGMVELDALEVAKLTTRVGLMILLRAAGMTAKSDDASARVDLDKLPLLVGASRNMTPSQVWTSAIEPGIADYRRVSASHEVRLVAKRSASGRIKALDFKVEKLFDLNDVHETVKPQLALSLDPPPQPVQNDNVEDDGDPRTTEQIRHEIAERRASQAEPFDVKALFPPLEPYPDGPMTEEARLVIIEDQIARKVFDNNAHTRFCMGLVAQGKALAPEEDEWEEGREDL